jgi:hypothetical protein
MHAAGPSEGSVVPTIGAVPCACRRTRARQRAAESGHLPIRLQPTLGPLDWPASPFGLLYALCAALAAVGRRRGARLSMTLG